MIIRLATLADAEAANAIYDDARSFMKMNGNGTQWNASYPGLLDVIEGIEAGTSYVCEDDGEVVATFHFETNASDPMYAVIDGGKWRNDEPYAVIHRLAVKHRGRGIVDFCFSECFKRFPNIRIDTHENNAPMRRCLEKAGFEYCGIVYLPDGDPRIAFQKC